MVRRLISLLLVLGLAVGGRVARAEEAKDSDLEAAKIHFQAGKQYYDRGHYNEAIGEFKEAYRLSQAAALLYNMSQAYERMGDLPRAREYMQKYIDSGQTDPGELSALQDKLRTLDKRLAEQRAAEDAKKPKPPVKPPVATAPVPAPTPAPVPPPAIETSAPRPWKTWKWVAVGVGAGSLILAGLFAADAAKMQSKLEDASMTTPKSTYINDLPDAYARGDRDAKLGIAFGIGGLAIGALGVVLFVVDGKSSEQRMPQAVITPMLGPGTAGATAAWQF